MSERITCKAEGCEKFAVMRGEKFAYGGFCSKHYQEQRQAKKAGREAVKAEARGAVSEKPVKAGKREQEDDVPEDFGKSRRPGKKIPFGWCMDKNHSHCRAEYIGTFGREKGKLVRCVCDCHDHGPVAEGVELA